MTIADYHINCTVLIHLVCIYVLLVLVGFASGQYNGSELRGFMEVIVRITGGVSSNPIKVTVTPSVQSPVSAMGM